MGPLMERLMARRVRMRIVRFLLGGNKFALRPPAPLVLRKVFKVGALIPDFGAGRSEKSYKLGLVAAKYS